MADAVISPNPRSIARVFADVNQKKGREYWDYEQLQVRLFCNQRCGDFAC